jgi:hypothetical protein
MSGVGVTHCLHFDAKIAESLRLAAPPTARKG